MKRRKNRTPENKVMGKNTYYMSSNTFTAMK